MASLLKWQADLVNLALHHAKETAQVVHLVDQQVAELRSWRPQLEERVDNVVTQTKFDEWLKSEFEPVQHQGMVAVPRTGFDEFAHHTEEIERQTSRGPSGSGDVRQALQQRQEPR